MSQVTGARRRLLVVVGEEPWPLDHGERLHLHNHLRTLVERFDVTLAFPQAAEYLARHPQPIRVETVRPRGTVQRRRPLPWIARKARSYFGSSPLVAQWLAENATPRRFDAALLVGLKIGQYIDEVRVPTVWDVADDPVLYLSRELRRLPWRAWPGVLKTASFAAIFQRHVANRAYASLYATGVDAAFARRWVAPARTVPVCNGTNCEYFQPLRDVPPEPGSVLFVGGLSFPPNIDAAVRFARRVWPKLRAQGGRRFTIVGRKPVAEVLRLRDVPGVELCADVPDVRPYLARAAVTVVPMRLGGGLKNKVLEACAMARPVVASPRAVAGLTLRRGRDVLCAERDQAWVRQVQRVLDHPRLAARIAQNGYQWVRAAHDWATSTHGMADIIEAAITQGFAPNGPVRAVSTAGAGGRVECRAARDTWQPCGV